MKTIEVNLTSKSISRSYKIKVDDEFALVLSKEFAMMSDGNNDLDAKDLLSAFVKKSNEKYMQTKELNKILEELKGKEYEKRF